MFITNITKSLPVCWRLWSWLSLYCYSCKSSQLKRAYWKCHNDVRRSSREILTATPCYCVLRGTGASGKRGEGVQIWNGIEPLQSPLNNWKAASLVAFLSPVSKPVLTFYRTFSHLCAPHLSPALHWVTVTTQSQLHVVRITKKKMNWLHLLEGHSAQSEDTLWGKLVNTNCQHF